MTRGQITDLQRTDGAKRDSVSSDIPDSGLALVNDIERRIYSMPTGNDMRSITEAGEC